MDQRLAAADVALKEGRRRDAIALLVALLEEAPSQPLQVYRVLVHQLYRENDGQRGLEWSAKAVARFPRDGELFNLHGVMLRRNKRYAEALKAFDQALKINPKDSSALTNKGNVYNDMQDGPRAEAAFTKLVRQNPRSPELQRALGRALANQRKFDQAGSRFRQALALKKDYVDAWLDLSGLYSGMRDHERALETNEKSLEAVPGDSRLLESKSVNLVRAGQTKTAEAFMTSLLAAHGEEAWLHEQLGVALGASDRARANEHLAKAVALAPGNAQYKISYAESLERSRHGDEAANIEAAYKVLREAMALGPLTSFGKKIASDIMVRVAAFDELDELGSFVDLGREWAANGRQTALLKLLSRVKSADDRRELIHQHRIWGRLAEEGAQRAPLRRAGGPRPTEKIRLGFMSSDLRSHPVAYFVLPLFENIDRERFEVFCYSFYQGEEDATQRFIASQVEGFRWERDISDRDAAQLIADDRIDILIELGGSTHMNKIEVMAYKPAPVGVSWLGYPHSAGLSTIDYLIVDPFLCPPDEKLLIEQPLKMPHSWIAMGERAFLESHAIDPTPPMTRKGFVTFGTANNPYKYTADLIDVWAQVLAAVPNSQFLFVRPEAGVPLFRKNITERFARWGVGADRIRFEAVRGAHMPFYNEIDIALDTFPQTGGTTTCESLFMGVPTVTVAGPALFERLSCSILQNACLGDLCAPDAEAFVATAVKLAGDEARITDLRHNLRSLLKDSPLGRTKQFAADFYDMVAGAAEERLGLKPRG